MGWICQKSGAWLPDEVRTSAAGDVHPDDKKANAAKAQAAKEQAASSSSSTGRVSN